MQQLVRVPGTYNTKAPHGGRHLVTLQLGTQRRYSAAELREAWPEVQVPTGEAGPLDWPEVEHWLGNLDALIGDERRNRKAKRAAPKARANNEGSVYDALRGSGIWYAAISIREGRKRRRIKRRASSEQRRSRSSPKSISNAVTLSTKWPAVQWRRNNIRRCHQERSEASRPSCFASLSMTETGTA